jgi:hypothetical protein
MAKQHGINSLLMLVKWSADLSKLTITRLVVLCTGSK